MTKQHFMSVIAVLYVLLSGIFHIPVTVLADETVRYESDFYKNNLYKENLVFDSQGNLQMTTRDKKADGAVRYRTIGWTMKRMKTATDASSCVRLKLQQSGVSKADPEDENYMFTYFTCDKDLIFAKIGQASADWQLDLYQNGGIVYMDAIMTVVENGQPLGYMDENGMLHGEVYTTAAGIMSARDWSDPDALRTHFQKEVFFYPVPEFIQWEEGWEDRDLLRIAYGKKECGENQVKLTSDIFDTTKGIPTGEQMHAETNLQAYFYEAKLVRHFGSVAVPVSIAVTYTYTVQTEKGPASASFTSYFTYYVQRSYCYYRIREIDFYQLQTCELSNESLPQGMMTVDCSCEPQVTLICDKGQYMDIPSYATSVYGGDLSSGSCISSEELLALAEQTAGEIWVRNDTWLIDDEVILDGSYQQSIAKEPTRQQGFRQKQVSSTSVTITDEKRNDRYSSYALAVYQERWTGEKQELVVKDVNDVCLHTPVTCKGGVTDDIMHNQQVTPTKEISLILGRNFHVGISSFGTHKDQKGYGTREYSKYVRYRQVRFPFEVYIGDVRYEKDTWIDLQESEKEFFLPVGVAEGIYNIRFRTVAKNAQAVRDGIDQNEYLANRSLEMYGAYDEVTVCVIGRIYDLAIVDIIDYPRWRNVFYERNGEKKPFAYRIGEKNLEGQQVSLRSQDGKLPILPGDHPYQPFSRAVGLGYTVKLQIKTVGSMRTDSACINWIPTYYYISRDGKERVRVNLYRKEDLSPISKPLRMTASNRSYLPVRIRNVADPLLQETSVQVWDGAYQLSPDLYIVDADIDLNTYIRMRGGRIYGRDEVFKRDGYLLVQFEIQTVPKEQVHLSYTNVLNSRKGYCNMWRLQGFHYTRTDCGDNQFLFQDGDCLLFDTRYTLHTDYESYGTH
ncbi:MAG: hypothetical protein J6B28_08405 [Eubacterium sp.]|nr:hypothetical protein [Eubacterium sp.]